MRLSKLLDTSIDPIRVIEWVIAVCTAAGGLYLFTPLYTVSVQQNGLSAVAATFAHPLMVLVWGALLLVSALLVLFGLWKKMPQIKSVGWFGIILARFFQILTTFLAVGFLPITWIYPFTIMLVIIVLWGLTRVEVRTNARA